MAAFRSLSADREPLKAFKLQASNSCSLNPFSSKTYESELPMHIFEWSQSSQDGIEISNLRSVNDLEARDTATVRVM